MEQFDKIVLDKELLIWDFDGTLVNLQIDWTKLKSELITLCQKNNLSTDASLNGLFSALVTIDKKKLAFAILEKYEHTAPYMPNAKVLAQLSKYSHKRNCIFSDNIPSTITRIISKLGISTNFELIISKEDVTNYKPHSEGLKQLIEKTRVNPSKMVYIGDSWKDKKIAEDCGVAFFDVGEFK